MQKLSDVHKRTIQIYEKHARGWDRRRSRTLFEKAWLDKFIELLPPEGRVLDIGCGAGEPIAKYLLKCGLNLTGIDVSAEMLKMAKSRFPTAVWIRMDMRELSVADTFDGIISWDGFFHLNHEEQRQMLRLFADCLNPDGCLLLTIGHELGEVTGIVEGEEVYHSSLAPDEYKEIL